jgi:hypothetical protein
MEGIPVTSADRSASASSRRVKPTLETKFHIDYDWWDHEERDLRTYLLSHLSPEKREMFHNYRGTEEVDWIDPQTAEVRKVDALLRGIREASQGADFINPHTSLVDAVFRVFLANDNSPLTPNELGERIGRPPMTILRTIAGAHIYKGIRPVAESASSEDE